MEFTVFVNPNLSVVDRRRIGNAVVQYIKERTRQGLGIGRRPFTNSKGQTRYSQGYIDTDEFDIAGKSPDRINLTLTGDMLDSIVVKDISLDGRIVIGLEGEDSVQKAEWLREKNYNFFGLSTEEQAEIVGRFDSLSRNQQANAGISRSLAERLARRLLG